MRIFRKFYNTLSSTRGYLMPQSAYNKNNLWRKEHIALQEPDSHLKKVKNLGWLTPLPSTVWLLHEDCAPGNNFSLAWVLSHAPRRTHFHQSCLKFNVVSGMGGGGGVTGLIRGIIKIPKLDVSGLCFVGIIHCYLFVFCKARFSDNFKKIAIILLNFNKW